MEYVCVSEGKAVIFHLFKGLMTVFIEFNLLNVRKYVFQMLNLLEKILETDFKII